MKKSKNLKLFLKKIYKNKRSQDGVEVGRKINDLTQALLWQSTLREKDKSVVSSCLEGLTSARKEPRFRDDFPSFSIFYKYMVNPKNGFSLEDIREL